MRRNGGTLVAVVSVAILVGSAWGAPRETEIEKLRKQVETLQAQLVALEAQVHALEARLGATEAKPAGPSAQESEAQEMINEVQWLADQGQPEKARAKLAEVQAKYPSAKAAGFVGYYSRELEVVGKDSPSDWGIEKWFQGEKDIDLSGQKTTLVVFWEEWCPHCKEEMPKLKRLYEAHKGQGLQVFGVTRLTQGATEEKVRAFMTENELRYPIAKETGALSSYFNVAGIPAVAIVKGGKIVWRGHPARLSEEMLKRWL